MPVQTGFFGKIPSRGDFVRAGLPGSFVAPWDLWLQAALAGSQTILGESWLPAWLEAPIWRFRLTPGSCGPDAAIGLFMPSVDRAGRNFPLTLACIAAAPIVDDGWLDVAEAAGLAALEQDLDPGEISIQLDVRACPAGLPIDWAEGNCARSTLGSPRVPATDFATHQLPDPRTFSRMLDAG